MSDLSTYPVNYTELMQKAGTTTYDLPKSLQHLIEKYLAATEALEMADKSTQYQFLPVLVQTDAVISAQIYQLYKDRLQTQQVDKVKLMALKAKALQLKWKLKKG